VNVLMLAINNIGIGLSGGDSIWINLAKQWRNKGREIRLFCCEDAAETAYKEGLQPVDFVFTTGIRIRNKFSKWGIFKNTVTKLWYGTNYLLKEVHRIPVDIIYSVSDFYPDFIPALILKLKYPKIKWVAGFFLFAPSPFQKNNPYKKDFFRGFLYWLSQQVSYPLIKKYADVVFVTNSVDAKRFPRAVVVKGGIDV